MRDFMFMLVRMSNMWSLACKDRSMESMSLACARKTLGALAGASDVLALGRESARGGGEGGGRRPAHTLKAHSAVGQSIHISIHISALSKKGPLCKLTKASHF